MLTVNDQTPDIMKHYWFIFQGDMLLLETTAHDTYRVPCADMPPVDPSPGTTIHDIGLLDDIGVKAFATTAHEPQPGFKFMPLRASYNHLPLAHYLKAGKCREIIHWDNGTRYCGACGTPLEPMTEISKRCPKCGREAWPQLNIAVIVLIRKADEVLLVQAKNFRRNYFGLVAGFVETGETLEQAVQREVMEETRLTITNLKYFASQPWPYRRLCRRRGGPAERRTLQRRMVYQRQPAADTRKTVYRPQAHRQLDRTTTTTYTYPT